MLRSSRIRPGAAALVEIVEQFLAVLDEPKIVDDAALLERVRGEHAIFFVVVGEKDDDRFCVSGHVLLE
jgi:hypothetical protein